MQKLAKPTVYTNDFQEKEIKRNCERGTSLLEVESASSKAEEVHYEYKILSVLQSWRYIRIPSSGSFCVLRYNVKLRHANTTSLINFCIFLRASIKARK